jgi:hypothetical protein
MQVEQSTQNDSYLKMKAQRERIVQEGKVHLKGILLAISQDFGLDKSDLMKKYLVKQGESSRSLIKTKYV